MDDETNLRRLSKGNEKRTAVFHARSKRAKSRSRRMECTVCLEVEFSSRAVEDICSHCLVDLWSAQDVATTRQKLDSGDGFQTVRMSSRHWDLPYPGVNPGQERVPEGAVFNRKEDPSRTFQILMHELVASLLNALPAEDRGNAVTFLSSNYSADLTGRMPVKTLGVLYDLWAFVVWLENAAEEAGFEKGHNLIAGLALGTHTVEDINDEIAKQTEHRRRAMTRVAEGQLK